MSQEITQILQSLGLTDKETALYLQSLQVGSAPASILGKRANINRSTAQYICQSLTQKGLMSVVQKSNAYLYTAQSPEKLHSLLEKERQSVEQKSQKLDGIMDRLKTYQNPHSSIPQVQYFQGPAGVIEMFEDVLRTGTKIYGSFRMEEQMHPEVQGFVDQVYIPTRHKIGNEARMIFNDNPETRAYQSKDPYMNRISLLVPTESYPFEICYHIYGDKIAFYTYTTEEQSGVIIQNSLIRENQFSLFSLAWDRARSLPVNKAYRDSML